MSLSHPGRHVGTTEGNRAMKPKDRMFPTIGEHDQLQLQQVVSETYQQRRWYHSGAARHLARSAAGIDPIGEGDCKSATRRH